MEFNLIEVNMKIIIYGAGGKMGKTLIKNAEKNNIEIVAGIDKFADNFTMPFPLFKSGRECNLNADVIIDFSRPDSLDDLLSLSDRINAATVIATTGYSNEQEQKITEFSKNHRVFKASNFSLGINLMVYLCKFCSKILSNSDIEIIEKHHREKVDAPSGTALTIAKSINSVFNNEKELLIGRNSSSGKRKNEIGISAVRGGTISGEHEVLFINDDEILTITHSAQNKDLFACGALKAAEFLINQNNGLYSMEDLIKLSV